MPSWLKVESGLPDWLRVLPHDAINHQMILTIDQSNFASTKDYSLTRRTFEVGIYTLDGAFIPLNVDRDESREVNVSRSSA